MRTSLLISGLLVLVSCVCVAADEWPAVATVSSAGDSLTLAIHSDGLTTASTVRTVRLFTVDKPSKVQQPDGWQWHASRASDCGWEVRWAPKRKGIRQTSGPWSAEFRVTAASGQEPRWCRYAIDLRDGRVVGGLPTVSVP